MAVLGSLFDRAESLGTPYNALVSNLIDGAQLGLGLNALMLDAATSLVLPPTVFVVLQTPSMYDDVPFFGQMLKSIIECQPKSVTGVDFGYTLDVSPTPVGHDGQNLDVPTKAKRTTVNPSFVFQEVSGNLIWNVFRKWLTDIQNPDTNASMSTIAIPHTYTMTTYSMTMMAIQFDPTMLPENIIDAACYCNMFPTATGELGLERQIATSKTIERTIPFTAIVQHNDYVRALATDIAASLQLVRVNFNLAGTPTSNINPEIAASGIAAEAASALRTWI